MNDLQKNQNALKAKGVTPVGHIAWWNVTGECDRQVFDRSCAAEGFKLLRKQGRAAFTSAVKEAAKGVGVIIRKITDDVTQASYVIADSQTRLADREIDLDNQTWVLYDKVNNDIFWKNDDDPRIQKFKEVFEHLQSVYSAQDIKAVVEREISNTTRAISLRPTGGVYFMPKSACGIIDKVSRLLSSLNNESGITSVAIIGEDDIAIGGIKRDFENGAIAGLDSMLERVKAGINVSQGKVMLGTLMDLEADADAMAMAVSYKSDLLLKHVARLRKKITESL